MPHIWTNLKIRTTLTILTGVSGTIIAVAASALVVSSLVVSALVVSAQGASASDPGRGRDAFERRCTGCHALDKIKVGPPLRGVFGRNAGKDAQFLYSDALKTAAVTWDEATLNRWLTDTESVIPDNDMAFRLNDQADRANIIAYLRQLSGK